jgi:zinc transporter
MHSDQRNTASSPFLFAYLLGSSGHGTALDQAGVSRWTPADGDLWLHLDVASDEARDWLGRDGRLPAVALDALLADETRPRTLATDNGLLMVLRGVNTNPGEYPEDMVSVRIWLEANRVITTRRRRLLSVIDIADALDRGEGPTNGGSLLAMLVNKLATRIGEFVDSIADRLDDIESEINAGVPGSVRSRLASLRRQTASVRRFLAPQRDALDRLYRQPVALIGDSDANSLREEADRVTRYLEDLELAREQAIVLQEQLLGQVAQEQNARMYVLSVVAAIFLPLTFVTGLLGMNVGGLPGVDSELGFLGSLATMVLAAIVLLVFFRWKKWL